jgi:hypothetical protein
VFSQVFAVIDEKNWNHSLQLYCDFNREDNKRFNEYTKNLTSNIQSKRKTHSEEPEECIEADNKFVQPFIDMFNEKFIWSSGEYKVKIKVITDSPTTTIEKSFKFTLIEYYEQELRNLVNEFKIGSGIYWYSNAVQSVALEIKEDT